MSVKKVYDNGVVTETEKTVTPPKCPYLSPVCVQQRKQSIIRKNYELQYNDDHEVVQVETGDIDIVKEINSHANEVGLTNVFANAIAHGENPYQVFKKDEPGVPFAIDENATLDEVIELQKLNQDKFQEVAKTLGVSVNDLVVAINDGTLNTLIASHKQEAEKKEGE